MDKMIVRVGELREPEYLNLDQRNTSTYDLYLKYIIQGLEHDIYVIEKFLDDEFKGFYFSKKIEEGCSQRINDEYMNELYEDIVIQFLAKKSNVIIFPTRTNYKIWGTK